MFANLFGGFGGGSAAKAPKPKEVVTAPKNDDSDVYMSLKSGKSSMKAQNNCDDLMDYQDDLQEQMA